MTSAIKRRLQRLTSNLSSPSNPSFDNQPVGHTPQHPRSQAQPQGEGQDRRRPQTVLDPELNSQSTSTSASDDRKGSVSSFSATIATDTSGTDTITNESSLTALSSFDSDLDISSPCAVEESRESVVKPESTCETADGSIPSAFPEPPALHLTSEPCGLDTVAPSSPLVSQNLGPSSSIVPIISPTLPDPEPIESENPITPSSTVHSIPIPSPSSPDRTDPFANAPALDMPNIILTPSISPNMKPAIRKVHGFDIGCANKDQEAMVDGLDGRGGDFAARGGGSLSTRSDGDDGLSGRTFAGTETALINGEGSIVAPISGQSHGRPDTQETPAISPPPGISQPNLTTSHPSIDHPQSRLKPRAAPRVISEARRQAEAEVKSRALNLNIKVDVAGIGIGAPPTPRDSTDPHGNGVVYGYGNANGSERSSSSVDRKGGLRVRDGVDGAQHGKDDGITNGLNNQRSLGVGQGSSTVRGGSSNGVNGGVPGGATGNRFSSFFGGGRDHLRQQNTQHQEPYTAQQFPTSGTSTTSPPRDSGAGSSSTLNGTPTRSKPLSLPRASSMRNRPTTAPTNGKTSNVPSFGFGSTRSPSKVSKVAFAKDDSHGNDSRQGSQSTTPPPNMPKSTSTPIHLNLSRFGVNFAAGNGIPRSSSVGFQRTFADDDLFGAGPASPTSDGEVADQQSGLVRVTRFPLPNSIKPSGSALGSAQRTSTYADLGQGIRREKFEGQAGREVSGAMTDGEWNPARSNGAQGGQKTGVIQSNGQRMEPRARTRSESGPNELYCAQEGQRGLFATYPMVTKDTDLLPMAETAQPDVPPEGEFPSSRSARLRRFSWEINRGVLDGKEFLGFGSNGEVGRVRLRDTLGDTASEGEERGASMYGTRRGTPALASSYVVGYERSVLKMEAMLHQAVYELNDRRHTNFPADLPPPRRVLDLGTGLGLWPIAMSQIWKDTEFVGMDIAPVQTDLQPLARVQSMLRKKGLARDGDNGSAEAMTPDWELAHRNISWRIGDILDTLPFDSGSFDMVHVRFGGLGIPENRYPDFLDEIHRVMVERTGVLEMMEMSYAMPLTAPPALRNSYNSLLLANFLHQSPHIQIRADLAMSGLKFEEVVCKTYTRSGISPDHPSDILANAIAPWVDSATGKGRHGRSKGMSDSTRKMGLPAFEARIAAELAKGTGGPQDEPLTAAAQNTPQSMQSSAANASLAGQKQSDYGEDDVVLVGWIARKK